MSENRRCTNHHLRYIEDAVVSYNIKTVKPDGTVVLDESESPSTEDIHDTHLYCCECMEMIDISLVVNADTWQVNNG